MGSASAQNFGDLCTSTPKQLKPLKPEQIRYLVFEGGGGKGFAYLGAIQVLERLKVMENIKGFGGASAGAITALLLSIGYTSKQVEAYLLETNFDKFFDPATPRKRPVPYGAISVSDESEAERRFAAGEPGALGFSIEAVLALIELYAATNLVNVNSLDAPIPQLLSDRNHYLAYLPRDMGLFSGEAARNEFGRLIARRYRKPHELSMPDIDQHLTFCQHFKRFRKKLVVTGTNLRSGKTQLFSKDHTPNFPVADAIRISMGLPWVYKPYVIDETQEGWPPCGVYVDGGVWNNLPFREFDSDGPEGKNSRLAVRQQQGGGRATLALRLEIEPAASIQTVFGLTSQMLKHGFLGSGETQVYDSYASQMVLLDVRGLSLLKFQPPKTNRDKAVKRARRTMMRYFGLGDFIPDEDRDDEDDLETVRLLQAAETCT
jgi:predicted acylesterase/phospholipase RssA